MVFVPTNFWDLPNGGGVNQNWLTAVNTAGQQNTFTNLLDKQLTGYTYMAYGALGDQPGQHTWHYLAPWQSLPEGTYIPLWKFYNPAISNAFADPANGNYWFTISAFSSTNVFPFPTTNINGSANYSLPSLPYIAFNYLGQLSTFSGQLLTTLTPAQALAQGQDYDQDFAGGGVDIPLAQGSVISAIDPNTRALMMGNPGVIENPPGNSVGITYNVIHIDPLTGRATLEYHKMQ